jgi:hypothetical protein
MGNVAAQIRGLAERLCQAYYIKQVDEFAFACPAIYAATSIPD